MDDILELAYFWRELNTSIPHEQEEKRTYTISDQARKYLQCLSYYPMSFGNMPQLPIFIRLGFLNEVQQRLNYWKEAR